MAHLNGGLAYISTAAPITVNLKTSVIEKSRTANNKGGSLYIASTSDKSTINFDKFSVIKTTSKEDGGFMYIGGLTTEILGSGLDIYSSDSLTL